MIKVRSFGHWGVATVLKDFDQNLASYLENGEDVQGELEVIKDQLEKIQKVLVAMSAVLTDNQQSRILDKIPMMGQEVL